MQACCHFYFVFGKKEQFFSDPWAQLLSGTYWADESAAVLGPAWQQGCILKLCHGDTILKKLNPRLCFFVYSFLCSVFIISTICFTQRCCKVPRSYLLLKSGVDSDLPADHQASSSAYQAVPLAPAWTLYLLSVAQDVEQHRHWPDSG